MLSELKVDLQVKRQGYWQGQTLGFSSYPLLGMYELFVANESV